MSAARRTARAGRNLLIALIGGAVIIAAIVVAYVAGRGSNEPPVAVQSTSRATTSVSDGGGGSLGSAPTGCLGGGMRTSDMVVSAQKVAQHSTYGAVEVATAFYRWSYRFPVPSPAEIKAVGSIFVPGEETKAQQSLTADYARNPDPSGNVIKKGTPFYLSTVSGRWLAQPAIADKDVVVDIEASFVIDGALSATRTTTEAFRMRWAEGAWRVAAVARADPAKLAAGGTTFTAGC